MRPTTGKLTSYQRSEIRRLRENGWTVGEVTRYPDEDNPWATIELSKGGYSTKAALPTTKGVEAFLCGEAR